MDTSRSVGKPALQGELRVTKAQGRSVRREPVRFTFNGESVLAFEGEPIAAALWAADHRLLRHSPTDGTPRGMFCAMGSCQECAVRVDGIVRTACNTPVAPGLDVRSFEHVMNESTPS